MGHAITGDDLKAWRTQQGLTQPQLAALLGVNEHTVREWERGRQKPPVFLALALERLEQQRPSV